MDQPTPIEEYRKKHTKLVEGNYGDVYRIRRIPPTALSGLAKLLGEVDVPEKFESEEEKMILYDALAKNLETVFESLLPKIIVEPKITLEPTKDSLGLDELNVEDMMTIFEEAMEFSELTKKQVKKKESFRKESIREGGGPDVSTTD